MVLACNKEIGIMFLYIVLIPESLHGNKFADAILIATRLAVLRMAFSNAKNYRPTSLLVERGIPDCDRGKT